MGYSYVDCFGVVNKQVQIRGSAVEVSDRYERDNSQVLIQSMRCAYPCKLYVNMRICEGLYRKQSEKGQINDRYESEFKTRTTIAAEVDSHDSDR